MKIGLTCGVTYTIEDIAGFDADAELLDAQRDVWAGLFSDPNFKGGVITLRGNVTTVGGKEQVDDILNVRCYRSAARQIDWDNVDADGIKQLCEWDPLVQF